MTAMCKNCEHWDHPRGRNKSGAAVYSARCLYKFDVSSLVVPVSITRNYEWPTVFRVLSNSHGMLMEPKEGTDCRAFAEKKKG